MFEWNGYKIREVRVDIQGWFGYMYFSLSESLLSFYVTSTWQYQIFLHTMMIKQKLTTLARKRKKSLQMLWHNNRLKLRWLPCPELNFMYSLEQSYYFCEYKPTSFKKTNGWLSFLQSMNQIVQGCSEDNASLVQTWGIAFWLQLKMSQAEDS